MPRPECCDRDFDRYYSLDIPRLDALALTAELHQVESAIGELRPGDVDRSWFGERWANLTRALAER